MAAAEYVDDGLGENGFDENFHGAAADEAVVVGGFIVEIKDHFARRFFLHDFFSGGPDIGFDAAATDGADQGTVFPNEHAGAFVGGGGAVCVCDEGSGA